MTSIDQRKAQLLKRLAELDERLHDIEAELDTHQSKDWGELAAEREDDEVLEGLGVAGQEEIVRIRAALQRVREGEYGYCTKCGDEVSEARLDVLPDTPFCKTCAASL
ncbi:TraR/DksA family transcriptional regulator [Alisedimentitalea sp. MJ-SS2]|uniref:TraR/DksA family transcriptional regulator n=1 Tax=Aliisedimentitalea sp. MJ-SS2 TaxID=3049795 RepID=UPI00290972C4|nr:TraR/DksA family transcriptional regulator [Alisedimentitalea sp. MJ-SS2]MDU8929105.1 TraR/DksA family transcriptional regulator [Alisedimentitalea sp. MJ-SS2]